MSDSSRGSSDYTQYFSGTNTAGQINYIERKPTSGGKFDVYVYVTSAWVKKTLTTDYTYANGQITWTGYTPPSGTDNIKLNMTAVMPWIYDDEPNLNSGYFPRISVMDADTQNQGAGLGTYISFTSGPGEKLTARFKLIVRHKRNTPQEGYVIGGVHFKNYDIVSALSEEIERYFDEHRVPIPWVFWDWRNVSSHRDFTEQEYYDILRCDLLVELKYYNKEV
jgi:hypothetical protein